jgi:hypothetical protein
MDNGIYKDDSDVIDIIEEAKAEWFAMHPECTTPTIEETDASINKELGLPATGSLRGLAVDLADSTPEEITANVKSGLDLWFGEVDIAAVEYYDQLSTKSLSGQVNELAMREYREDSYSLSVATRQQLDFIDSGLKAPCLS